MNDGTMFDGKQPMPYVFNDGGRADAGFKGNADDCVARSIAIASARPYAEVYKALAEGSGSQRASKNTGKRPKSARNGVDTGRKWFKDYMTSLGFRWEPTMAIGEGCKVHLVKGELPSGRLVVAVSRHYTAVINGVIYDNHDPSRATIYEKDGVRTIGHRCVYGYWYYP